MTNNENMVDKDELLGADTRDNTLLVMRSQH